MDFEIWMAWLMKDIIKVFPQIIVGKFQVWLETRPKGLRTNGRNDVIDGNFMIVFDNPRQTISTEKGMVR